MKLSIYLKGMTPERRADFAVQSRTTLGHINNVQYGTRTASAALTRSIAQLTERQVAEWDLRPDDWHLIWPELIGSEGAPAVAAQEPTHAG